MEGLRLPRRLSWDKLCQILVGYLNAGANEKYVSVKDVAEKAGVDVKNVSRNNRFFISWGFLEGSEEKPRKYRLTEKALKFAAAYRIDSKSETARRILRDLLSENELVQGLARRIDREGFNRQKLLSEIPIMVGDARVDTIGVQSFLDMLAYAFGWEETGVEARIEEVKPALEARRAERRISRKTVAEAGSKLNLQIQLVFNVDSNTDVEKLSKILEKLVELLGLTED